MQHTPTSDLAYWLALLRAPGVGCRSYLKLLEQLGHPGEAFSQATTSALLEALPASTREWLVAPDWAAVQTDLDWLRQPDAHAVTLADSRYPSALKQIADPPPVLFVRGDPLLLASPQLAMVGSRNPSAHGRQIAHQFAKQLAGGGLCITSGLALGIDAAAHSGALEAEGLTVAVMGTSLDQIYPARHHALARQIAQTGALVSEFPTGTPPVPANFPRRNRIISGLSLGTLVVEASVESGSLITARCAAEQGREVFAIPGSINNPMSRGCHRLIKEGAKLVECIDDILSEFPAGRLRPTSDLSLPDDLHWDNETRAVLTILAEAPASIDTLVLLSGLPAEAISSILVVLELHNLVSSSGGLYCRL